MDDRPSDEDLIAAVELALENEKADVLYVAKTIREHLGWRRAVQAICEALWALRRIDTEQTRHMLSEWSKRSNSK